MKVLRAIDRYFEEGLCVGFLTLVVFFTFCQVLFRFVFNLNLDWTEEFARYSFVGLVYMGIGLAMKYNRHIRVEIVEKFMKGQPKLVVLLIAETIWLWFGITMVVAGWKLTVFQIGTGQTTPVMEIPMAIFYAFVPIGFALMSIRLFQLMVQQVLILIKPKKYMDRFKQISLD